MRRYNWDMGIISLLSLLFVAWNISASPHGISAQRPLGVSWETLASERQPKNIKSLRETAIDTSAPLPEVDFNSVPQLNDYAEVEKVFKTARDLRFLDDPVLYSVKRRSTWLFPDDGCYARAALAIQNLQKVENVTPKKIFAYGNLMVKTPNTFEGYAQWWYHVAPIVAAQGKNYVLDPAMEPNYPLTVEEWASRMGGSSIKFNICDAKTYLPYSSCESPPFDEDENAIYDQEMFLPNERERILDLGRNADEELGEHPPWML